MQNSNPEREREKRGDDGDDCVRFKGNVLQQQGHVNACRLWDHHLTYYSSYYHTILYTVLYLFIYTMVWCHFLY